MPTSAHEKEYLQSLLGFEPKASELEELINKLGMTLEKSAANEIEVEYQANRPDLISTVGLARAIRYYTGRHRSFGYRIAGSSGITVRVQRNVRHVRPYISCMLVKNASFTNSSMRDLIGSIDKLSETFGRHRRRIAVGIHDAEKITGEISYGVYPDEEFEALGGATEKYSDALERTEKGKAYSHLCKSSAGYCALKDSLGTMALIPVLNSERTKLRQSTKELFVDVTGTNEYAVNSAANLLAANFIDMGFDVYSVEIAKQGSGAKPTPNMERRSIDVKLARFYLELGTRLGFNNVIELANRMGYEAALHYRSVAFSVPPYRLDVINDQDIIEDIAIAYGYENINPVPIGYYQQAVPDPDEEQHKRLRSIMTGLGFSELLSDYMTNERDNFVVMGVEAKDYIKIKNAKSSSITMLRTWLLPSIASSLSKSQHDKLPHRLFELDLVFSIKGAEPLEKYHLACAVSNERVDINEMKEVAYALLKAIYSGKAAPEIRPVSQGAFIDGRCAELLVDGRHFGIFGEIKPEVLESFGIKAPVVALEIEL
ncbi:MAG: phenylalanine--tRNA ligase subunit beta [Candidatus Micrarchaeaceae archaeon]